MNSQLVNALRLKMQPVAVILTNDKPAAGLQFKEGSMRGCVGAMLVTASKKNRIAFFDRKTFGCPGGGTGLGTYSHVESDLSGSGINRSGQSNGGR